MTKAPVTSVKSPPSNRPPTAPSNVMANILRRYPHQILRAHRLLPLLTTRPYLYPRRRRQYHFLIRPRATQTKFALARCPLALRNGFEVRGSCRALEHWNPPSCTRGLMPREGRRDRAVSCTSGDCPRRLAARAPLGDRNTTPRRCRLGLGDTGLHSRHGQRPRRGTR